ncbi:MAG: MFS transporter [Betaproteobacteria bacterium]
MKLRLPGTVWVLGVVSLLMDFSSELIHGLLPIYLTTTLGVSVAALGWIEGAAEATASTVKVFSGTLSDALGKRKPLLLLGYGLAALTKPLFPLATGAGLVLTARLLDRVGKGIRGAPRDALVADVTPADQRGAAYGLRQALDMAGSVIGPLAAMALLAGVFGVATDVRGALWFAVFPAAAAWLLLLLLMREPSAAGVAADRHAPRWSDLRSFGRDFWAIVILGAVFTLARFSEAFLVLRVSAFDPSPLWGPAALMAMSVVYMLVAYPAGLLADRIDVRGLLGAGLTVLIGADLVLATATSQWWALAGAALWGLHMGLTQGVLAAMVAGTSPSHLRGSGFGLFNLISGVMMLVASVLAGALWQHVNPAATFVAGGALCAICLASLPWVRPLRPAGDDDAGRNLTA